MLIAGVLCVCAAVVSAGFGTWSLSHGPVPTPVDTAALALRAMAPTQLAAAIMLAAGGLVALVAAPHTALVVVIVLCRRCIGHAGRRLLAERAIRTAPGDGWVRLAGRLRGQLRQLHPGLPLNSMRRTQC